MRGTCPKGVPRNRFVRAHSYVYVHIHAVAQRTFLLEDVLRSVQMPLARRRRTHRAPLPPAAGGPVIPALIGISQTRARGLLLSGRTGRAYTSAAPDSYGAQADVNNCSSRAYVVPFPLGVLVLCSARRFLSLRFTDSGCYSRLAEPEIAISEYSSNRLCALRLFW